MPNLFINWILYFKDKSYIDLSFYFFIENKFINRLEINKLYVIFKSNAHKAMRKK